VGKFFELIANHWFVAILVGFAIGLAVGLFKAFRVRLEESRRRRELQDEIEDLREHIHRQMKITAKGSAGLEQEMEDLREKNENLRATVKTLENKPGRAELRQLHVYDRAIRLMQERAPGFAGAWESALREAEQQVEEAEKGVGALMRRVVNKIPLVGGDTRETHLLEAEEEGTSETHPAGEAPEEEPTEPGEETG
jgi:chromosome segregation ATPase